MGESKETSKSSGTDLGTFYLLLYNAVQTGGWFAVLVIMVMHLVRNPSDFAGVFDAVELPLLVCQTGAVLEVVHAAVGLVRTSAGMTAMQVASRLFNLYAMYGVPGVRYNKAVALTISAWSITEVIRYAFYFASLMKSVPYALLWCRYTFFYLLYPLGVLGELLVFFQAIPEVGRTQQLSFSMPNKLNFSFSFYYFLAVLVLAYIPCFPMLYCHMISQRRKYIGAKVKET